MMDWSEHYIEVQQLLRRYQAAVLARDWDTAGQLAAVLSTVAAALKKHTEQQGD